MIDEETDDLKLQVRNLLAQLKYGSEYLENYIGATLGRFWEEFCGKVVTFYETKPAESVKKVCRYRSAFPPYFECPVFCSLCV